MKTLKEIRKDRGYSQGGLAKKVDISPVTLSRIETDKNQPSIHIMVRLARSLDLSPDDVWGLMVDMEAKAAEAGR